jgi:hypothetical protein
MFSVAAQAASSTAIETLLLRGDWPAIAKGLDVASATRIEDRALRAHALLASNDVNSAYCGFATFSSESDRISWERWTFALAGRFPDSAVVRYLHADAQARLGRFGEAIAEFTRALKANPDSVLARNGRGVVYASTGRDNEALLDFATLSAAHPDFVDAQINRGYLYIRRSGSAVSQAKAFGEALRVRPDAILALIGEGRALAATGKEVAGVHLMDRATPPCRVLDDVAAGNRRTLFAWVKKQNDLEKSRTMAYAGTTLSNAQRDIDTHRDVTSVMRAFDIAAQSDDPRAKQNLFFTLKSMEVSDKQLGGVINQALTQERAILDNQRSNLTLQDSQKYQVDASISGQLQRAGIGVGGNVKATLSGDLKNFADYQLNRLDQADSFLKDLTSKLPSSGGAETFHLGVARIDIGDAPRPYHNTLLYLPSARGGEGGR